jgi:rare lipoprotein A
MILALLASVACREATRVEEGVASFYADSFHGSETASGEKYNKRADTAAHRTLAFGTRVKVTNLEDGKSVWVRINDRGPQVEGRIIDLSGSAARKLGITKAGTAKVRLEIYE